ncbi:MAG: class I SAM-dependent methyltransferase [Gammaproteobacteria bacterium]
MAMSLPEATRRLDQVDRLVSASYEQIYAAYQNSEQNEGLQVQTGFQGMPPALIRICFMNLLAARRSFATAIDLGCGNGVFALMAAALGWDSYGIDASEYLIEQAILLRDQLRAAGVIAMETRCEFAVGSIYPPESNTAYEDFVRQHAKNAITMPVGLPTTAYAQLGITLSAIDVIYAFTWSDQMPFLCQFLNTQAQEKAVFVLPHYRSVEGKFDEDLRLKSLPNPFPCPIFLGERE